MPNQSGAGAAPHADEERYELVGRIAGGVAHDLNNHLSTVTTFADLLQARCDPGSSMSQDLVEIKEAGLAAAETLRRLQLFARPGRHAPEVLDVSEVARSMEPLVSRLLGPAIQLDMSSKGPLLRVCAPTSRIEELLLALAGAARRSMPGGGTLALCIGPRVADVSIEASFSAPVARGAGERLALLDELTTELDGTLETRTEPDGSTLVRVTLPGAGE